ncbi:amidohydrolase family protein [Paraburkholderia sp. BR10937]|uniref:amidohydrolase family protein n=1 Tax=Paraburkholderia sp. BR10937 TaxID=3236994 RepID=UPI0034D2C218
MSSIALDVHTHLVPGGTAALPPLDGVVRRPADGVMVIDGQPLMAEDLYHPERLLAWMEVNGVQRALVSVPPPLYRQHLDAVAAHAWACYLNDGLLEIANRQSAKLGALLHLPMEHPAVAQALAACYGESAHAGYALAAGGVDAVDYGDPARRPLWERLDAQGAFVFLHPAHSCDCRLTRHYMENLLGNPYETAVAASQLVMADVPRQYPRIRFCLAHAGGAFPAVCGRLQRGLESGRPGVPPRIEPPLQAARRFFADCIAHQPAGLRLAQEVFGRPNVLFGSDWPFPMGIPTPGTDDTVRVWRQDATP